MCTQLSVRRVWDFPPHRVFACIGVASVTRFHSHSATRRRTLVGVQLVLQSLQHLKVHISNVESIGWRRRVEVESTIRSAKGRIAGFEGREGHRTPFAPAVCNAFSVQGLLKVCNFGTLNGAMSGSRPFIHTVCTIRAVTRQPSGLPREFLVT